MKVELKYPIAVKSENGNNIETSVLNFGRLKAKHIKLLPESVFDAESAKSISPAEMLPLIAGLTNVPLESIEELDMVDLMHIGGEVLPSFLDTSQPAEKPEKE